MSAHLPSRLLTYTPDTHFECLPTRRTPRTFPLSDLRHSFIPFPLIRPTTLLYSVSSTPDHSIVPLPVLLPSRIDASALQDEHLFRIAPQVICLIVLSAPRSHKESERPTPSHVRNKSDDGELPTRHSGCPKAISYSANRTHSIRV